jgi:mutator protein MutT
MKDGFPDPSAGSHRAESGMLEVGAGLVFHEDRLLITQRRVQDHLGGLWEFPGGKRHADESFEDCVRRELYEELGIEVEVGRLLAEIEHAYPDRRVRLRFFRCTLVSGEPQLLDVQALAWITAGELDNYLFPAADTKLLDLLRRSQHLWAR